MQSVSVTVFLKGITMLLQKRLMWPKQGEYVQIVTNGKVTTEGIVNGVDESNITIMTPAMSIVKIDCRTLEQGIEDRSIVVRKTR